TEGAGAHDALGVDGTEAGMRSGEGLQGVDDLADEAVVGGGRGRHVASPPGSVGRGPRAALSMPGAATLAERPPFGEAGGQRRFRAAGFRKNRRTIWPWPSLVERW